MLETDFEGKRKVEYIWSLHWYGTLVLDFSLTHNKYADTQVLNNIMVINNYCNADNTTLYKKIEKDRQYRVGHTIYC